VHTLAGVLPGLLSRAFEPHSAAIQRDRNRTQPAAPQSIHQSALGPTCSCGRAARDGQGSPSRVSAPVRSRTFEQAAIRAMSSPCAAPCVAADPRRALDGSAALPQLPWTGWSPSVTLRLRLSSSSRFPSGVTLPFPARQCIPFNRILEQPFGVSYLLALFFVSPLWLFALR
jgi:hypothetical protein